MIGMVVVDDCIYAVGQVSGRGIGQVGMEGGGPQEGGVWDQGLSRIDQAPEEANCATFEDGGTITLLGSCLASGRKPNNERKSALIFRTGSRLRLLPG